MRRPAAQPLLISGAAGTLTVDSEETCRRLGQPVAALLLNRDLPARRAPARPAWTPPPVDAVARRR